MILFFQKKYLFLCNVFRFTAYTIVGRLKLVLDIRYWRLEIGY
jgi:hypothetical protein